MFGIKKQRGPKLSLFSFVSKKRSELLHQNKNPKKSAISEDYFKSENSAPHFYYSGWGIDVLMRLPA